jgi:hypothetical protein
VEDRISGLEGKIDLKEKNRKPFRQKTQNLWKENTRIQQYHQKTKIPISGIEEGEKVQVKGICNIFNKIIAENLLSLKNQLSIQV